jgi:hypothetical protein
MDDDLRGLERAFREARTPDALRAWLVALVRAGRADEVPALVGEHARGAVDALGATRLGDRVGLHTDDAYLDAWRLPAALGDHVLLVRWQYGLFDAWRVGPGARFTVVQVFHMTLDQSWSTFQLGGAKVAFTMDDPGEDRAGRVAALLARVADVVGGTVEVKNDGMVFGDGDV